MVSIEARNKTRSLAENTQKTINEISGVVRVLMKKQSEFIDKWSKKNERHTNRYLIVYLL